MIKYLELTAPDSMQLRGAKIIKTEVAEGDSVKQGDPLFTISNNGKEEALPAAMDGRVVELIAKDGDGVSLLTPLVLFETNVEDPPNKTTSTVVDETPSRDKNLVTVKVPDIGGDTAKVVEILVKPGDHISVDDAIVTLESDKASMEVPSTAVGTVQTIIIALDAEVGQGDALIEILRDAAGGAVVTDAQPSTPAETKTPPPAKPQSQETSQATTTPVEKPASTSANIEVAIPDIGGDSAKVVEILVSVGDTVDVDDALVTLESDKASMEVPSSAAGEVVDIKVKLEDDVSEGVVVVVLKASGSSTATDSATSKASSEANSALVAPAEPSSVETKSAEIKPAEATVVSSSAESQSKSHASPSIRRFARELGANLGQITGSGRKGRVTKDDVKGWVKQRLQSNTSGSQAGQSTPQNGGSGIPAVKIPDFSKFGETKREPLGRIKQLTAQNLHRSWLNVPHVTHNDEANVEDLESFRKQMNEEYAKANKGVKLSPLAFIVKAVVNAMQKYPQFNSSLSEDGTELIMKQYYNIGIAVDTPEGLVVPVIRSADTKSVADIAQEMGELAGKARDKKLSMTDMSGACFTISSLGGIGGTGFTPIVNAPEVAILGVSRTKIQPHWDGKEFVPAPFLPLSLSYDHRVIDGAEAARFTRQIASVLEDVRRLTVYV